MGSLHAACLKSFVVTGHQVFLHTYGEVSDAPEGIWYADANRLVPEDKLLRYPNGSYAISANLIRYELMRQECGLYIDCDVFCLRPIADADYIFGFEDDYSVNGAVLKLPADTDVVRDLCSIRDGWVPPWSRPTPDAAAVPLDKLPWASTGTRALTHYVRHHNLIEHAAPYDVFYPVYPYRTGSLYDPGLKLENLITPRTKYVHFYHAIGRNRSLEDTPANTPIAELIAMLGRR